MGGEGRSDEAEEELTEGWYWQEPSGLSSSLNTASQPIRWHRTGAAVPLFAASVVDIAGALSLSPPPALERSRKILLALEPTEGIENRQARRVVRPETDPNKYVFKVCSLFGFVCTKIYIFPRIRIYTSKMQMPVYCYSFSTNCIVDFVLISISTILKQQFSQVLWFPPSLSCHTF